MSRNSNMDPTEVTKVIDNVYKNIVDTFTPCSREMILTGKAYLKALHGASAASSLYLEALTKISKQAKESSLGCSVDIGTSLLEVAEVFKEIHTQQLNTLKAFYVDFLVPLETNLEKDTRVIQNEQKKFLLNHKCRLDGFIKASTNAKKLKKKSKRTTISSSTTIDKEIKIMQELEEEKTKLETFCEKALAESLTQERRRYGFILERQASLGKHYLGFFTQGTSLLQLKLDNWIKISKSREILPQSMQHTLLKRLQQGSEEDCIYCTPRRSIDEQSPQIPKSKSMESSQILHSDELSALNRAKSELNILPNNNGMKDSDLKQSSSPYPRSSRPNTLGVSTQDDGGIVKALFAYLSSGENQLSFLEGDIISLIGERSKGWQFGENLRTQKNGWFPVAYAESTDPSPVTPIDPKEALHSNKGSPALPPPLPPPGSNTTDSYYEHQSRWNTIESGRSGHRTRSQPAPLLKSPSAPRTLGPLNIVSTSTQTQSGLMTSDSLHSSNDSGFSNDLSHKINQDGLNLPPQPEVDYSDDEPPLPPPLPNSGALKSGDRWLMEKYQKSESARLGTQSSGGDSQIPRRALSFLNLSTHDEDEGSMIDECERGRPRQRPTAIGSTRHHSSGSSQRGIEGDGALKKFLNRTKSLIWKRGASPPPILAKTHARKIQSPPSIVHRGYDSISAIGSSVSELWGSHASLIIDMDKVPPPSLLVKETGEFKRDQDSKKVTKKNQSCQTEPMKVPPLGKFAPPPLPPPLPFREPPKHCPRPKECPTNNSGQVNCLEIKKSIAGPDSSVNGSLRRTASEKVRRSLPTSHRVLRVESFSGSEAPIVPNCQGSRSRRARSKAAESLNSETFEDDDSEELLEELMDDGSSSLFIEEDEELPTPTPSTVNQLVLKKSSTGGQSNKGSLRLLGRRSIKSESLRIGRNQHDFRTGTPESKVSSMQDTIEEVQGGKRNRRSRRFKGSIRSEVHTLEVIETSDRDGRRRLPHLFEYGTQLQKRLYFPERTSKLDQKSERTGNLCGPWYDLWGIDSSVSAKLA